MRSKPVDDVVKSLQDAPGEGAERERVEAVTGESRLEDAIRRGYVYEVNGVIRVAERTIS